MILPSKHENLNSNTLVLGASIIKILKKRSYNLESLYREFQKNMNLSLDKFYNILLFLWLADIVELDGHQIFLRNKP